MTLAPAMKPRYKEKPPGRIGGSYGGRFGDWNRHGIGLNIRPSLRKSNPVFNRQPERVLGCLDGWRGKRDTQRQDTG